MRTPTLAVLWFTKDKTTSGRSIMYKVQGVPADAAQAVIASMELYGYRFVPIGSSPLVMPEGGK